MARIQSEIGLEEKMAMLRGQAKDLHKILAKSQSKKLWDKVSWGPLQRGQTQASISTVHGHKPTYITSRSKNITSNLPKKMLEPSLHFQTSKGIPIKIPKIKGIAYH